MNKTRLYMVLLGCRPKGRLTEQHDVFFGTAESLKQLVPAMKAFWPDSGGMHIDAWREVNQIGRYKITVEDRAETTLVKQNLNLFFINLGGYRGQEFEELHHKLLVVAESISAALRIARQSDFFRTAATGTAAGAAHVDDKYGFDIDEIYRVEDLLPEKEKQYLRIELAETGIEDAANIGYLKISLLK